MNDKNGETVIDLLDLLGAFIKKIWLVLLLTAIGAVAALGYTLIFVKPLYKASALMYVNNSNVNNSNANYISTTEIQAAKSLVDTYAVILESPYVINEVTKLSGVDYSNEKMAKMVEAKAVNNTEIFSVTVTSTSPEEAEKLANLYAQVLPEKITSIVNGSDVKVVDYAKVPTQRSSPSYSKNTLVGALLGFVVAAAIIVIGYLSDDIIHSEEYLSTTYPDIPLLTVVPDLYNSSNSGYGYYKKTTRKPASALNSSRIKPNAGNGGEHNG